MPQKIDDLMHNLSCSQYDLSEEIIEYKTNLIYNKYFQIFTVNINYSRKVQLNSPTHSSRAISPTPRDSSSISRGTRIPSRRKY